MITTYMEKNRYSSVKEDAQDREVVRVIEGKNSKEAG
jgi:hypothetical protein